MEKDDKNSRILTCPWFSVSDRKALFQQLFEGSREEMMRAIGRVDAWKARSHPQVPLGLEVTASLVRALVAEDRDGSKDTHAAGASEAMLCMALVRFVNLVTEFGKATNGASAVSINSIAIKVGIPEWIVDLRHASTHSVVPSLDILRMAAEWCLDWVKVNYWLVEDECIEDVVNMPPVFGKKSVQEALYVVKADLLEILDCDGDSKKDLDRKVATKNRLASVMKTVIRITDSRDLAQMLMNDGLIFPESQLVLKHSSELEEDPTLAARQFKLWWPVLHLMGKHGYLVDLIEALVDETNRRPCIRRKFASVWISLLVQKFGLIDKLKSRDWKGYIRLIRMLLKRSPLHAELAIGFLPKEKIEALTGLALTKASLNPGRPSEVQEPQPRRTEDDRSLNERLMVACPLGMLPEQMDVAVPNLDLPSIVDDVYHRPENEDLCDKPALRDDGRTTTPRSAAWLL